MREHKQSINLKFKKQPYSPFFPSSRGLSIKDSKELDESIDTNVTKLKVVKTSRQKPSEAEIIRETIEEYRRNKKVREKVFEDEKEIKRKETLKAQIPTLTHKNISQISASLTHTENQAAANYVDFQKHFVKLNCILYKTLDGII
jgi:hypothetical protein